MVNMLYGDPYKFSIFIENVIEWNSKESSIHNGVLLFCIDGHAFPSQISTSTFEVDVLRLRDSLENIPINKKLINVEKHVAFIEMYKATFSEDYEMDIENEYFISPPTLSDYDYYIFAVSDGENVRITASKLDYIKTESTHNLNDINIIEAYIKHDDLNNLVSCLNDIIQKNYSNY